MNVSERLQLIHNMCIELSRTTSRLDKEYIVKSYRQKDEQLSQDIDYVFEILSGMHKLGYTFISGTSTLVYHGDSAESLEEFLRPLSIESKEQFTIYEVCGRYRYLYTQLAPILNRIWRIGINKSQLAKTSISPMLAKKYEPGKHCVDKNEEYYITEKLDGNRCISYYDVNTSKWKFMSRSGKELKVQFDMLYMPLDNIYDGEILSRQQIENPSQHNFNALSGALNSKYGNKNELIYIIFDIVDEQKRYSDRRRMLNNILVHRVALKGKSNVDILPIINCLRAEQMPKLNTLLEMIEDKGGEGLMINIGSAVYQHKRTDKLLKVKSVYTMDMKVIDWNYGTGKYEDAVGSLICEAWDNNIVYECSVGSGLSDDQRYLWANEPKKILGKIVEVAYFSLSQDKTRQGTTCYSLRFPRLKRIRDDKTTTSVD